MNGGDGTKAGAKKNPWLTYLKNKENNIREYGMPWILYVSIASNAYRNEKKILKKMNIDVKKINNLSDHEQKLLDMAVINEYKIRNINIKFLENEYKKKKEEEKKKKERRKKSNENENKEREIYAKEYPELEEILNEYNSTVYDFKNMATNFFTGNTQTLFINKMDNKEKNKFLDILNNLREKDLKKLGVEYDL